MSESASLVSSFAFLVLLAVGLRVGASSAVAVSARARLEAVFLVAAGAAAAADVAPAAVASIWAALAAAWSLELERDATGAPPSAAAFFLGGMEVSQSGEVVQVVGFATPTIA